MPFLDSAVDLLYCASIIHKIHFHIKVRYNLSNSFQENQVDFERRGRFFLTRSMHLMSSTLAMCSFFKAQNKSR